MAWVSTSQFDDSASTPLSPTPGSPERPVIAYLRCGWMYGKHTIRGFSPTTQLPLTILPLGAASPGFTEAGWSFGDAADSLSWSSLPDVEPMSVT
ncbi:hypothetical protein G6F68_019738 [Rhizopus microsporus]|nr:hypothetical protein G6F68_019738 [Rhizopus microsporus]